MPLKLANRRIETTLQTLAEPLAVLAMQCGLEDERASLRAAWKFLLKNQAHDSIGGCSVDRVHRQMWPRYRDAAALAQETAARIMERLAGQRLTRQTPVTQPFEVAIYNPSPYRRSGYARLKLDAHPSLVPVADGVIYHPVLAANWPQGGYAVDGVSVAYIPAASDGRFFHDQRQLAYDLEIPVTEVPAYGYKRVVLERTAYAEEVRDEGREIGNGHMRLALNSDGSIELEIGEQHYSGLFGIEDRGDRGDSYDADILADDQRCELLDCNHRRRVHENGTQVVEVERLYRVPRELDQGRQARSAATTVVRLYTDYVLYPHSDELRVAVRLHNTARDHRLRLLFPVAGASRDSAYASTFDVIHGGSQAPDDSNWLQAAPSGFVHQGWVYLNGLSVVAPGLPEAEVLHDGTLAVTLVRSIGWLSRHDLSTRKGPAGPVIRVDEAQCLETVTAEVVLFAGLDPIKAQQAEVPLVAVFAGDKPLMPADRDMLSLGSDVLLVSAFKPAEEGDDYILRLLNPGAATARGQVSVGFDLAAVRRARLDEQPEPGLVPVDAKRRFAVEVQAHQLLTLRLSPG
jgi:mannosylglycerate hydrolase